MKTIHIEFSDERLFTPSGLMFVGQILGKSSFIKKINRAPVSDPEWKKVRRRRIRTVISNLMQFSGHLTEHAGRLVLSIGRSQPQEVHIQADLRQFRFRDPMVNN